MEIITNDKFNLGETIRIDGILYKINFISPLEDNLFKFYLIKTKDVGDLFN